MRDFEKFKEAGKTRLPGYLGFNAQAPGATGCKTETFTFWFFDESNGIELRSGNDDG